MTVAVICAAGAVGCQPGGPTSRPVHNAASTQQSASATASQQQQSQHSTGTPTSQPAVAMVNGQPITLEQLQRPLLESYGLNVLLNLVQLELARQHAAAANATVAPADIAAVREATLAKMFKDAEKADYDKLLEQFLAQQRISRPEFDLVIETNAYLRKIAEPMLKDKITEENLQEAFRTLYGENVEVRDIQVANLQEIAAVRQRLSAGEPFEQVAREMSRDPRTKAQGGLLPPFSRQMTGLSESFKEAAFALREPGEVSDPVQTGDSYHLIQLVRKIAPKAVKYEDVRESVRQELYDRWMEQTVVQLRRELARTAMQTMDIKDPTLRKQFEARLGKQQAEARERDQARLQLEQQRKDLSERQARPIAPSTAPAGGAAGGQGAGANGAATAPGTEARDRPPATKSGQ